MILKKFPGTFCGLPLSNQLQSITFAEVTYENVDTMVDSPCCGGIDFLLDHSIFPAERI